MTPNSDAVSERVSVAVEVLRRGGLVGLPTETVYGLAADARNEQAVRKIFVAKQRPSDHPLIVHIADAAEMETWAKSIPSSAETLARSCWPGPLSIIVDKAPDVLEIVTGGRDSVALRVPAHPLALTVLRQFGGGVAAPSANRFGKVSPTTADHVRGDLGDLVDFVLDGGPCQIGVESTIVDCTQFPPQILRPGGIPNEHIERLLDGSLAAPTGPSRASGMLTSHYAPNCRVQLARSPREAERLAETLRRDGLAVDVVDPTLDTVNAATHLYGWFRDADSRGLDVLIAVLPPPAGLGHAIRDRLTKAAGQGYVGG